MSSASATIGDVVQVPAVSGEDILFIPEDELGAPQGLSLSETGGQKGAFQPLNLSQYYYGYIYLKL